jgi:hypothetical protein
MSFLSIGYPGGRGPGHPDGASVIAASIRAYDWPTPQNHRKVDFVAAIQAK